MFTSIYKQFLSPDGKLIVTASVDGTARVWNTSKKLLTELRTEQAIFKDGGVSPDGKLVVIASSKDWQEETLFVWDLSNRQRVELKGNQKKNTYASFSQQTQQIITVSEDKIARLWDTSGKLLA